MIRKRPVHRAERSRDAHGSAISAACFSPPRRIDLGVASLTFRDEAVTCPACLAIMAERKAVKQ